MPFKQNAARRHRMPQARYRVRNWPAYEAGLKRRGDLTLWLGEDAIAGWHAPRRATPGGQPWYSDAYIELVLMLRLVFHLALPQADGFAASLLRLLGQELRVPDHATVSRRSRSFAGRRPKVVPHSPMHLVIDGTGLKPFGRGEWDAEKHGQARRLWRKLHIAVDADTGEIVACALTGNGASYIAGMRSNTGVRKPAARKLSARKPATKAGPKTAMAKKPASAAKKAAAGVRTRSAKSGAFTPIRGHARAESSARAELSGLLERVNRTIDETEALLAD